MISENSFRSFVADLKKNDYYLYSIMKYQALTCMSTIDLKNIYPKFLDTTFDELISYFETIEDFEKCRTLLDLKHKILK